MGTAVLCTRVEINSLLSSISAFSTDLKRIEISHRLFWDFGADKYLGLPGQVGRASTKQGVSESAAVTAGTTGSLEENMLPLL